MADETKIPGMGEHPPEVPTPEAPGGPPVTGESEQAAIPGIGDGPAPAGKVVDLEAARAAAGNKEQTPVKEAAPVPEPPAPRDATRGKDEKIVRLNLDELFPCSRSEKDDR